MSSRGSVVIRAYTATEAIPVEDVTIVLTQRGQNGTHQLLGLRMTDANGQTTPISVETPDRELSEAPSEEISWSECDITAEHPGYVRVVVENVQIFPETVTVQEFALVPQEERPDFWGRTEVYQVTPQEL